MLILSDDIGIGVGLPIGGGGIGFPDNADYSDPVISVPFSIAANAGASAVFCADGPEVIGAELQTNSGLTGTTGTSGGGGTITGNVADSWYVLAGAGTTATVSKEAITDDQIIASAVGTSVLQDNANSISFVSGQFYELDVKVAKLVGTCQASVANNAGANVQLAAVTLLQGTNRVWFKAASTNVGTIRFSIPASGSLVIRSASIKTYSPTNYLRASINTGSGYADLWKCINGVVTNPIHALVPVMNKNYAPTGCCTDPDWDLDVTTGWAANFSVLASVVGGNTGKCLSITGTGAGTDPSASKSSIAVKPGETYTISGYSKAGTEATTNILIYDITNTTYFFTQTFESGGTWGLWSYTFTVPNGCVSITIYLRQNAQAPYTSTIFFDDVSLTKTSTDDLLLVVDKTNPASAAVSFFRDGVQFGTTQAVTDAAILNGKRHYLSGDYGPSVLYKRRFALGSELVVNGGFDADTAWIKGTGWDIGTTYAGKASSDGSQIANSLLYQENRLPVINIGKVFQSIFTVSNYSAETIGIGLGGYTDGPLASANGKSQSYIMPVNIVLGNRSVFLLASSNFVGSVDDVSVKEVLLP